MADYISIKDIADRMPDKDILGLADETGLLTEEDINNLIAGNPVVGAGSFTEAVQQCVDDAQSEVNTYLENKYNVPFASPPKIIIKTTAEIAIYYLYSMGFQDIPDNWANRYKQAVTLLKEIAKGNICLGASEKTDNTNDSVIVAPARIFTRDTLKGY